MILSLSGFLWPWVSFSVRVSIGYGGNSMAKLCRITVLAYMWGPGQVNPSDGYGRKDLEIGIEFCEDLIDRGYIEEPMDHFNLRGYIKWANMELMRRF